MNAVSILPVHRFRCRRPGARRLGPQGNPHRRNRNARPDGDPRGIRRSAAAEGRAHHRLAAHDHPDRGADRDADRAGRRRCAGRRATSSRPRTTPPPPLPPTASRCSRSRANRWTDYWDYTHRIFEWADGGYSEHDPRRRRRRHAAAAPGRARREGHLRAGQPGQRRRARAVRRDQGQAGSRPDLVFQRVWPRSRA